MSKTLPRRCWVQFYDVWECCILHAWSMDYMEERDGFYQFPVGVVERGGGRACKSVDVSRIHFTQPEDWDK